MMEKIVHAAKQVVKAMVESQSARLWSPFETETLEFIVLALSGEVPVRATKL